MTDAIVDFTNPLYASPLSHGGVGGRFTTSTSTTLHTSPLAEGGTTTSTTNTTTSHTSGSGWFGIGITSPSNSLGELSERDRIETEEEAKLANSSALEKFMRWWTSFWMEFLACLMGGTLVLATHAFSGDLARQAVTEGLVTIALLSIFARENAFHKDAVTTMTLVITGKYGLPWYYATAHLLAQVFGAIVSTLFVWAMTPGFERGLGLGTPTLAPGITPGQGMFFQFFGCLVIQTVFLWAIESSGRRNFYEQTSSDFRYSTMFILTIGAVRGGVAYAIGSQTGTYFDWYLYFFPGVISGTISSSDWWVWFVGPLLALVFSLGLWFVLHWWDNMAYQTASRRARDDEHNSSGPAYDKPKQN